MSSLDAYLEHYDTLSDAIWYLDHVPELLWHADGMYPVDAGQAAGFIDASQRVDESPRPAMRLITPIDPRPVRAENTGY